MFETLLGWNVQAVSSAVVFWLGQAMLFGTALAVLTWLAIRLLRHRGHPGFEVAVWSIVLFKFVVPLGPASSVSFATLLERATGYSPVKLAIGDVPGLALLGQGSSASASAAGLSGMTSAAPDWKVAVTAAYLAAVSILMVIRIGSYRRLVGRCRSLPVADEATRELVGDVSRRYGLRRVPSVRIDKEAPTTFMIGVFKTLMVISGRQLARPSELETVIVHEIAHLKRGDMFVRCLQWVVSTLLFFWPVVAWVNRRIDEAREYACDDWALRHGKLTAREYARCLLNAIQPMRMAPLAYRPPCMAGHPSTIERRINMVLESPDRPTSRRTWGLSTAALVLLWGGFALSGGADAGPKKHRQRAKEWPATEEAFKNHLDDVMKQVGTYKVADLDDDGELSYWEKTAFVTTLALNQANALVAMYPYADANEDGELDITEACDFVRGLTLVRMIEKKVKHDHKAAIAAGKDEDAAGKKFKVRLNEERLIAFHEALDAQQWLLAEMTAVPHVADLEGNSSFIVSNFAKKKKREKEVMTTAYAELDGLKAKMKEIKHRLASETDAETVAKLEQKFKKLQAKAKDLEAKLAQGGHEKIVKKPAKGNKPEEMRKKKAKGG